MIEGEASAVAEQIVILGAGQAAAQAADTLRRGSVQHSICIIGDEPHLPYHRPPLSKQFLAGAMESDRLLIRRREFYRERSLNVRLGRRAAEIDRRAQRIRLDDGSDVAYDALLIATGSRPRRLAVPGHDLAGVRYLRTIADADALKTLIDTARRLVVIGGGYIGMEIAATCRELGLEVTVLEFAERTMKRTVGAEISALFEAEHARRGVKISCNVRVTEITAHPHTKRARSVLCDDGTEHLADLVVVGVGVEAEDSLAFEAGIERGNGIKVDAQCRTSDPRIYAAGDCANFPSLRYGSRVRIESVDNAFEQAACAARNMLGEQTAHDRIPWFWSDQYDLKLTIVGLSDGHDMTVIRGAASSRNFSVCYLRNGELIAVGSVNQPRDRIAAGKLIAAHAAPNAHKLADPTVHLNDCV